MYLQKHKKLIELQISSARDRERLHIVSFHGGGILPNSYADLVRRLPPPPHPPEMAYSQVIVLFLQYWGCIASSTQRERVREHSVLGI